MNKQDFITWATGRGWVMDKFGHLQKSIGGIPHQGKDYRFKLSSIAVRYEIKVGGGLGWTRIKSGYFKDLSISPDNKLIGMK